MKDPTLYLTLKEKTHLPIEHVDNLTIPEYLLRKAEEAKDENVDWLINGVTGERRKYGDLENITRKIGSSFYKRGLRKGDTVIFMNHDMFYVHALFIGIWRANGIVRTSYPEDDEQTLLDRVEESRSKWILCEPETAKMCLSVASKVHWDVEVIVIGEAEGCTTIDAILEDDGSELPDCKISSNDFALILCTSGTTGKPKGAAHTHSSLLSQISTSRLVNPKGNPNLIASKAMHISGIIFPLSCIANGGTALIIGKISKENLFKAIHTYRPGLVFGFPTFLLLLVNDPAAAQYDFSSVEVCTTGGAPILPAVELALKKLPNFRCLINSYGLTEVIPIASANDPCSSTMNKFKDTPPSSVGKVVAEMGVAMQIRHIDTNEILGPHQRGEIWVKSKSLFHSYYNNVEETRNAFTDGWFKTGDVGYYDENGFLFLVDRTKEIFKYYNNHISPTELEEVISKHSDVAEVCVVGINDPDGGDRIPRAFVKLKVQNERIPSAEEIKQFANGKLPDYKRLRGGLYILKEFPTGKTGKVSRQLMVEVEVPSQF